MKREDLALDLRREYKKGSLCGVEKISKKGFENLWFVVPPSPPRSLPPAMPAKAIARAIRQLEELPKADQADELARLTSFLFLRREAVQSSRMEGTWSTIDHVLTPGELYDGGESRSERGSVLGYAHALDAEFKKAFETGTRIFTLSLACRLHKEITSKDPSYRGIPGKIRTTPVFIGGLGRKENSVYNPTPPRHVSRCLKESLSWMADPEIVELGDAGMGLPLPVRMAIGHSHFEAVHPFTDGNGRVGRMLMTLQMAAHGVLPVYLSGFIEAEKQGYVDALQKAQKELKYGPIVEFISEAIVASHQEAKESRSALEELPESWRERGKFRTGSAAELALKRLITNPIITVARVQELLNVSKPAANNAVSQLEKAAILRERTGHQRYRVFAAEEVIELLARKFAEPASAALARGRELMAISDR